MDIVDNRELLDDIWHDVVTGHFLIIEMVSCYNMKVGETIFETCVWIGRFLQAWCKDSEEIEINSSGRLARKSVLIHMCGTTRVKDKDVRKAVIKRYPATGGGQTPQIGIKAQQGPLYGVHDDIFQALGLAITCAETMLGDTVVAGMEG